jgi:hypothetical protein
MRFLTESRRKERKKNRSEVKKNKGGWDERIKSSGMDGETRLIIDMRVMTVIVVHRPSAVATTIACRADAGAGVERRASKRRLPMRMQMRNV